MGCYESDELVRIDIEELKKMGVNTIRIGLNENVYVEVGGEDKIILNAGHVADLIKHGIKDIKDITLILQEGFGGGEVNETIVLILEPEEVIEYLKGGLNHEDHRYMAKYLLRAVENQLRTMMTEDFPDPAELYARLERAYDAKLNAKTKKQSGSISQEDYIKIIQRSNEGFRNIYNSIKNLDQLIEIFKPMKILANRLNDEYEFVSSKLDEEGIRYVNNIIDLSKKVDEITDRTRLAGFQEMAKNMKNDFDEIPDGIAA